LNYLVLYPENSAEEEQLESLVTTAFNNIGIPNAFQLISVDTKNAEYGAAHLVLASKFVWSATGMLIMSDSVWQALLQKFNPKVISENSGYLHLIYLNPDEPPLMTLKVDDMTLGLNSFCEYVKWLVLEASYFEVRRIDSSVI
jgi:hypothetical protein